jgi:hypothetical protein
MQSAGIRDAVEALGYEQKTLKESRTNRKSIRAYDGIRPLFMDEKPDEDRSMRETRNITLSLISDLGQNNARIGSLKNPVSLPAIKDAMLERYKIENKECESIIKKLLEIGEIQKEIVSDKKGSIMYISKT